MDEPVSHSTSSGDAALSPDDTPGDDVARQTTVPPSRAVGTPVPKSRSLDDVHNSVPVSYPGFAKRLFAFLGPAYLISVGYMDPGNWATDIEGGARFSYELVWILLMSNAMAILLQTLAARLGIVSGRDLAQACGESYSRPLAFTLWILCEIAIAACDLAEVIGTVIGLNLLFGIAPLIGLIITAFDTFVFLAIQRLGIRKTEAFIVMLVGTIGACFLLELALAKPEWKAVFGGFIPYLQSSPPFVFSSPQALYVAIGILGATVMPHNLYLHSALVQTRRIHESREGFRQACRYNLIDSVVALNLAFLVNAAILITAAAARSSPMGTRWWPAETSMPPTERCPSATPMAAAAPTIFRSPCKADITTPAHPWPTLSTSPFCSRSTTASPRRWPASRLPGRAPSTASPPRPAPPMRPV
jgi:hypothetical protein